MLPTKQRTDSFPPMEPARKRETKQYEEHDQSLVFARTCPILPSPRDPQNSYRLPNTSIVVISWARVFLEREIILGYSIKSASLDIYNNYINFANKYENTNVTKSIRKQEYVTTHL